MVIKKDGSVCCLSGLQNYRLMCCFKICNVPIDCSNRDINHLGVGWGKRSKNVSVKETKYAGSD